MSSDQVVLLLEFVSVAVMGAALIVYQRRDCVNNPDWSPIRYHGNSLQDQLDKLYLIIYLLVCTGHALQSISMPSLYESYGYGADEIRTFRVVALGSAALPGLLVASCTDRFGRRKAMQLFSILYLVAMVLITDSSMASLVASQFLIGIGNCLLGSVFEAWFFHQHRQAGFHPDLLSLSFSSCFFWTGLALLPTQLIAYYAKDLFGQIGPVYIAGLIIGTGLFVISACCTENYGNHSAGWHLPNAFNQIITNQRLQAVAISQILTDSAIALVTLNWPAALNLSASTQTWVTNYFLICTVIGAIAFAHIANGRIPIERVASYISIVGAGALSIAAYFSQFSVRIPALFVFKICAGLYWPCQATLRCNYVAEDHRVTTLALFGVPVALVQIAALYYADWLNNLGTFWICSAMLSLASVCQQMTIGRIQTKPDAIIAVDEEMATA